MKVIDADALREALSRIIITDMRSYSDKKIVFNTLAKLNDTITKVFDEATTIELQPQWIPVTERLPENEGDFIVTANDSITGLFVVKDHCYKGTDGKMRFLNQIDGNPYHNHDGELKRHTRNIIAWMPLPKPYKPEKIEDDDG